MSHAHPPTGPEPAPRGRLDRRRFLALAGSCSAHLALLGAAGVPRALLAAAPGGLGAIRTQEPWGSLVEVAEGVWALISDPFSDSTTVCNGGIVAGRSGVALVEAFATPRGAAWLAAEARRLTGRPPDVALVTHHHGDHSRGLAGYRSGAAAPELRMTAPTRDRIRGGLEAMEPAQADALARALDDVILLAADAPLDLDLGGRRIRQVPREGHTASDVTVELDDPSVVFCGDLVWNAMFPNYVDARPTRLGHAVASLPEAGVYVPGHGPLADPAALARYREVLDAVEEHARRAREEGRTPAEAAEDFNLPAHSAEWTLFSPAYFERALDAWYRDLDRGEEELRGSARP